MRINRISILFLLFLLAAANALWAGTLEGTVLDPLGQVVPGAHVSLNRSLVIVDERQTDARGIYRFEGLQDGTYQLAANAPGLTSPPMDVEIRNAGVTKQEIHLMLSALISQVVVSASLGGALAPEIGSSVSVITRQDIDDRGAQNAFEVIRGIPGIEVSQAGRSGGTTGVYMRGGESNYNAVMVDGIPLNQFGGDFDLASLPADGIERIEVIRGPESALYGPNALTGVINIVSRKGEGPPSFTVLAEGGSHATRRFATGGSGLNGGFSWSYNFSRMDTDGVVQNDEYRNQSAFISLGYRQNSQRQFDFHFFGNANDAGAPGPYGSDPNHLFYGIDTVSRGKQNLFGYQLGYTEQVSSRFRQVTTVSLATNDTFYHSPYGDSDNNNLRGIFNTRSEIAVSERDTLAAGFEFNREQTRYTYLVDNQGNPFLLPRTSLGYFVENRWSPSDRLHLITGVRLDNLRTNSLPPTSPTDFNQRPFIPATSILKVNPRLSLSYLASTRDSQDLFGGTRLHGSFGTGIRPPDSFELGYTNNPGLKPERSVSFDAGVEQKLFASRSVLDFTYFYNRFQDQIVTLGGSMTNLSSYRSANLKNSKAQGLEVSFRLQPVRSLEMGGEYTFLDSAILALDGAALANAPFQVGQPLVRRPRNSASYNLAWKHRNLMLHTNAYIRGATLDVDPSYGLSACSFGMPCFFTNKGYTRVDAGFSYRILHGVEIYGRLNNVLNQKYEEVFGYPALRLNFVTGMKFSFSKE